MSGKFDKKRNKKIIQKACGYIISQIGPDKIKFVDVTRLPVGTDINRLATRDDSTYHFLTVKSRIPVEDGVDFDSVQIQVS